MKHSPFQSSIYVIPLQSFQLPQADLMSIGSFFNDLSSKEIPGGLISAKDIECQSPNSATYSSLTLPAVRLFMLLSWANGRCDHTTKTTKDNLTIIVTTAKAKCIFCTRIAQPV